MQAVGRTDPKGADLPGKRAGASRVRGEEKARKAVRRAPELRDPRSDLLILALHGLSAPKPPSVGRVEREEDLPRARRGGARREKVRLFGLEIFQRQSALLAGPGKRADGTFELGAGLGRTIEEAERARKR